MSTSTPRGLPLKVQALVTTWSITAFILFGAGWLLGLEATWWQRVLLAIPVASLAYLDSRGHTPIVEIRARLTRLLAELGAIQLPWPWPAAPGSSASPPASPNASASAWSSPS